MIIYPPLHYNMSATVTEISDLLRSAGFQQVVAPLGVNLCDVIDPVSVDTVAYGGKVCNLPQSYQTHLEMVWSRYPQAQGLYTIGYVYLDHTEPISKPI